MNQAGASCLRDALALNLLLHCTWDLWVTLALWLRRLSWRSSSQRSRSSWWFQQHVPEFPGHPAWDGARSGASASSSCLQNAKPSHTLPSTLLRSSRPAPKALSTDSSPRACQAGSCWWRRSSPALQTVVVWQQTPGDLPELSCPVLLQRIFWLQIN